MIPRLCGWPTLPRCGVEWRKLAFTELVRSLHPIGPRPPVPPKGIAHRGTAALQDFEPLDVADGSNFRHRSDVRWAELMVLLNKLFGNEIVPRTFSRPLEGIACGCTPTKTGSGLGLSHTATSPSRSSRHPTCDVRIIWFRQVLRGILKSSARSTQQIRC